MTKELRKLLESLGFTIVDAPNDDKIYGVKLDSIIIDDVIDDIRRSKCLTY